MTFIKVKENTINNHIFNPGMNTTDVCPGTFLYQHNKQVVKHHEQQTLFARTVLKFKILVM